MQLFLSLYLSLSLFLQSSGSLHVLRMTTARGRIVNLNVCVFVCTVATCTPVMHVHYRRDRRCDGPARRGGSERVNRSVSAGRKQWVINHRGKKVMVPDISEEKIEEK